MKLRIWVHLNYEFEGEITGKEIKRELVEPRKDVKEKNKTIAQLQTTCRHSLRKTHDVEGKDVK